MRLRPERKFVLFGDTSEMGCLQMLRTVSLGWQEKYAQGTVSTSLKSLMVLEGVGRSSPRIGGPAQEVPGPWMDGSNGDGIEPKLGLLWMGLHGKETDRVARPAAEACRMSSPDRHAAGAPASGGCAGSVLHAEEIRDRSRPVQPHSQPPRGLKRFMSPGAQEIERKCSHETPGSSFAAGEDPEASSSKGPGSSVPGGTILGLDPPEQHLAEQVSTGDVGRSSLAAQEGVRLDASGAPRPSQVRLQNRSNLCYIHSVLQAVYWLGRMSTNAASCFGQDWQA